MLLDWLQRTCAHPNQMQNTENNNDCDTSIFPLLKADQSSCISILTDESTEISVTRMFVVYMRLISLTDFKPVTHFLTSVDVLDDKAETVTEAILKALKER